MPAYTRPILDTLLKRLTEPRRFIQVLAGPRQVGKTTLARQAMERLGAWVHYASADEPQIKDRVWLEQQWDLARLRLNGENAPERGVLILDEIQKIPSWSESVKRLWDEDSAAGRPLHLLVLGSSPLLMQKGLAESLAGRFELIPVTHWSYSEMSAAFGWDLDTYIFYGGYPGSASLISEPERWARYILDSLVETTLSRDIFLMTRVDKPALLRRLFELGCAYSGQILSYQKMLGQLQDTGNTVTLAHYLNLLQNSGLVTGLSKYAGQVVRQRGSSPKFLVQNTALFTAPSQRSFQDARKDPEFWGRLVESAVGAHLANSIVGTGAELFYWSSRNVEVDFVLTKGEKRIAFEVKSTRRPTMLPGLAAFEKEFGATTKLLVGGQGMPLEEFFRTHAKAWAT